MTKEQARELANILTAYANGADLQYEAHNEWVDMKNGGAIVFCVEYGREMRVKPKQDYRPFKSCNELIAYWHKKIEAETKYKTIKNDLQVPLIWVKHKVDGRRRIIVGFGENFVEVGVKAKPITLERLFEMYTFLDGSPCGVSE